MLFLVTGITGHVGGVTAQRLLDKGHRVRALVRNLDKARPWADKGVQLVKGDFHDRAAVADALRDVHGAFLMLPPVIAPKHGFPEARTVIDSYVEGLRESRVRNVVALSSIGSEKNSGLGLITATHMLEEALMAMPFPVAFIRAGSFFENYLPMLDSAAETGALYSFMQPVDVPVSMVATCDIGKEAARLLASDWEGKRFIELGTPTSPNEIARAMSETLGRHIVAHPVPRDQWTSTLEQFGFPAGGTGPYEEMTDSINSGWICFGAPGTEPLPGSTLPGQVFSRART